MKTKRKQHVLFAILLCCTLFWGIFPLAASADEGSSYVAWIGETGYTSLEDAVNSAKNKTKKNIEFIKKFKGEN